MLCFGFTALRQERSSSAQWGAMDLTKQKQELARLMKKVGKVKGEGASGVSVTAAANRKGDYRGVKWHKRRGKWEVKSRFVKGGAQVYLGMHSNDQQDDAALIWAAAQWSVYDRKNNTKTKWVALGRHGQLEMLKVLQARKK